MQNKEIQTSNSKINKEVINPKKEISLIKPLLSNQNDMIKHKSQSSYNPHSPKNTSNTSNPTSSNFCLNCDCNFSFSVLSSLSNLI